MVRARVKGPVLLAVILVCGTLLRLQDVTAPWVGRHNAWGGATYGHIARNYVTYG